MTAVDLSKPGTLATTSSASQLARRQKFWGFVFLSPWVIGFLFFTLIPIVTSLVISFTDFNLNKPDEINFVGLENYLKLFKDPILGISLQDTLRFGLISLPMSILLPLGLALLLNSKYLIAQRLFRTLFYMPYVVPTVSAVAIWRGMLSTDTGWINRLIALFGGRGPDWVNSVQWIYPALYIIGLWGIGNVMLIMLASLQGVPTELYEAARVDGARPLDEIRFITLPMISPVIFYNLVLSVIGLFQYFDIPYMLSAGRGDPANTTMFFNIHLYKTAFTYKDMAYGSTLAWVLFLMAFVITVFLFRTGRHWVFYAGGEQGQ